MPHAVCWREDPRLIWTMVVTNSVTFLSYSTICVALIYLARKTHRVIARDWAFFLVGFALFIVACGSTHLLDVITTWIPVFWIDAWTNIITAILSAYVAVQFVRRTSAISVGVNDYADSLSRTETEKAQIQHSLLSARRLEEWNQMSSVVTHEISNPLDSIQNLLYLIRESPGISPEVATMAEQSAEEVRRVIGLTRSTLGFFRQGSQPEQVDLRASAESVRFLLDPLLRQKSIELSIQSTGNCTVNAFAVETRQVLLNLVRNACDATTRRGSSISITMEGRTHSVNIVVEDQAGGIDPAILKSLFQFGASTKGERGNGMGLWVVRQFVTRHGGTITVDSTPAAGTRFTIVWPREFAGATPPSTDRKERVATATA
jgi:signal transduction histidine kinase